jgi:hypothetical protein
MQTDVAEEAGPGDRRRKPKAFKRTGGFAEELEPLAVPGAVTAPSW